MANKGFGAEKINLIGGGTPNISSPNDLNLTADNVAISTNASIGGNLTVSGGVSLPSGIVTATGHYGPIYIEESSDDNVFYDIPFLNSTGSANNYRQLQIDAGQLQFNASDNSLRLYGALEATRGFSIGIQSAGTTIVDQSSQYIEGINFAGVGNTITYNSSSRYVTVEIAGGAGGGIGTNTSVNTTGIITAAAFNSPYYNSGVPYIGVGAGATQIEFQAPNVAITTDMTVGGAINAAGAVFSGIATGTFVGDGSGLIGLAGIGSGIQVMDNGTLVGMAQTIDFGLDLDVSNISAGICTVSNGINLVGIDTVGVSRFNHIDASGIVTATSFDTIGGVGQSPVINSGIYTTLTLNSPTVAISTDMTVGGNLTVTGTINGSNLGGTLSPDGINMMGQKYIMFFKDNSTAFSSHNSEMYGTSSGTTIWREYATAAGDGIRIGTKELTIENQSLYGYMAKFTAGGPVWLSWGGHTGEGNEHKQKLATSGIGVSVLYDYQTLGHMDVRDINATGVVTATSFSGDGSGLTGVTATGSGIVVKDNGSVVGTAATVDFGTNLSVSAVSAGVVTVTASGSGGGGSTAGIDTAGVSHFNHINAVGVITATTFASYAGGASSITSPGALTIAAPHVAITTSVSIGGTASIGDTLSMFDDDLKIFKNNTSGNVVIQELGGGSLNINANDLQLKDYLGQTNKARFITGGQVELYFANNKRFETTGAGATVYGSLNATQFVGDGSGLTGIVAQGTGIVIQDEGSSVGTAGTINFVGAGVSASLANGIATIEVTATGGGGADPVGTIVAWSGSVASIPSEYQLCDGSAASTTALQAITGANVPDLRNRFVVGAGTDTEGAWSFNTSTGEQTFTGSQTSVAVGQTGGSVAHKITEQELPAHQHGYQLFQSQTSTSPGGGGGQAGNTYNSNTNPTGSNQYHENRPPYYALCYIIKHSATTSGVGTGGGGGTTQNLFESIAVSGQSNVTADSATDVLTFVAGSNMTITTDAATDTITFNSTGGGGGGGGGGTSGSHSWTAASQTSENVDTVNLSTDNFRGAEYHIHVEHSQGIQSQKVLIMQDGTSAYANEFAIMHDNSLLVSIGASVGGGNFYLSATPESGVTGLTTVRFLKTVIS